MKILIISDSHGHHDLLRRAIGQEAPIDMLIHAGDVEGNLGTLSIWLTATDTAFTPAPGVWWSVQRKRGRILPYTGISICLTTRRKTVSP